ncbi:acyltransferase [Epilithonimonas sp.]|uniref:acyltransferase family protein n=1 Tax=Epilithonimonas sp. TaxID=2894511 RepID=UPI00289EE4FE|nr:acyltransferase [Epilithonimonas sp.]
MSSLKVSRVHFHTFDSLRFISFLLVFLHHSPIPKDNFLHYFSNAGGIGVSFFFVLSGFLITYILLLEKINNQNRIPLKSFFKRRILRIWPLYYAMVLFAFCTPFILNILKLPYSNEGYQPNWFFTLTFLENYVMMYKHDFPNVSPLRVMWSLCIEEHFYIIWGLVFYFISLKNVPKLIIICIIITFLSKIIYKIYNIPTGDILTNIDYFAFGAIPAYIFIFRKDILQRTEKIASTYKYLFALIVLATIVFLSNSGILQDEKYSSLLFASLFSLLILSTLGGKNVFKISDKSIFAWLGKYTYGLYLIHTICINLFSKIGSQLGWNWFIITIISLITTVVLSFLSYHLFEKQFLKLKD